MVSLPVTNRIERKFLKKKVNVITQKKLDFLKFNNLVTNIKNIMNLFETILEKDFKIKLFWTLGFVTWVFGLYYWAVKAYFESSILIGVSLVLGLFAIFVTVYPKAYTISSSTQKIRFSPVILIVSVSSITMVALDSVANAITLCVILLIAYSSFKVNQVSND